MRVDQERRAAAAERAAVQRRLRLRAVGPECERARRAWRALGQLVAQHRRALPRRGGHAQHAAAVRWMPPRRAVHAAAAVHAAIGRAARRAQQRRALMGQQAARVLGARRREQAAAEQRGPRLVWARDRGGMGEG